MSINALSNLLGERNEHENIVNDNCLDLFSW